MGISGVRVGVCTTGYCAGSLSSGLGVGVGLTLDTLKYAAEIVRAGAIIFVGAIFI